MSRAGAGASHPPPSPGLSDGATERCEIVTPELIKRESEARIREWARSAGEDPEDTLRAIRGRFRPQNTDDYYEALARSHLRMVRYMLMYHPEPVFIEITGGLLSKLPPSPPTPFNDRMLAVARAIRQHAPEALIEDLDDSEDADERLVYGARVKHRVAILEAFNTSAPGLAERPSNGELAILSLWLHPTGATEGREANNWSDLHQLERRAMKMARDRFEGGT